MAFAPDKIPSDRDIRDEKPGNVDVWKSVGGGLYIRVRAKGVRGKPAKTWVIRRKRSGKTTTETIGEFPAMNLAAARAVASRRSLNPNLARITFGELLDEWYTRRIEPRYRVTKNARVYIARAKAEFGSTPVARLSKVALVRWLQQYAEQAPVAANRCCSTLKLALSYADECGYIDSNPLQAVTVRVIGGEEKTRNRTLSDAEISAVWNSGHKLLRFLLLTGLRISEAQQGERIGDKFHVARTKNGSPHWVFLPPLATAQLDPFTTSPTSVQSWLQRWCAREQVQPFTPHDLRRTFATRLADIGIAPHVIEKCLNHRMQGVMGIYNRHDYEAERIYAASAWANEVERLTTGGQHE